MLLMIMSWFVINVFCFEWFSRHFFFQQSVGAVPLGVSVARKKEDEASVGSAPLARQQSNQASEYASSPVKTKTITGMITPWLKLTSSFFRLTQWIACTVWQYQLWEYCGTTLRFTEILSQKMATSLIKKKIIKLVILKYTRNIYLIFSLDTTPGVLILIAIY